MVDSVSALKMKSEDKVFSSGIERGQNYLNSDLYELLRFDPAQPTTTTKPDSGESCNFQHKTDKAYIPKKSPKVSKVKTVRNIREQFEEDCQSFLAQEILAQENQLFASIRIGSLSRGKTVRLAKSLIKGENPLSRSTWQMLTNINPHKHNHSKQCILYDGTIIRVNGSKGGDKKFICQYDLAKKKLIPNKSKHTTRHSKSLLKAVTVDFKPGPLTKKTQLDVSYQKFNVGEVELMKLPKIGLDVQPSLGIAIEPTIRDILASNRSEGKITENWALFAASTLGVVQDSGIKQLNNETITFDMFYTNDQNQILMRRDSDVPNVQSTNCETPSFNNVDVVSEVTSMVEAMLCAVEISLTQDHMYTGIEEVRELIEEQETTLITNTKDKSKKKLCELQRLDVTVIRLSDSPAKDLPCTRLTCVLGCVCTSLKNEYSFKNHCGRFDCMFECKCDFSRFKIASNIDDQNTEFIPGLLNLDTKISSKLAKEEKKFHQTVVVTDNDSILLKTKRRSLKTPKRYAEFMKKIKKTSDINDVTIVVSKLDCNNVEPWCMVHNLYRCFCKGRFTECIKNSKSLNDNVVDLQESKSESENTENEPISLCNARKSVRTSSGSSNSDIIYEGTIHLSTSCARTTAYQGRSHSDSYYCDMNVKIVEMEANDEGLQKRLIAHVKKNGDDIINLPEKQNTSSDSPLAKRKFCSDKIIYLSEEQHPSNKAPDNLDSNVTFCETSNRLSNDTPKPSIEEKASKMPNRTRLIAWLEANYKHYKQRLEQGQTVIPLEPPKLGKIALYPWEVILERYKLRKNFFVVTPEPPYRIFIAVDLKNPILLNCINIDRIPFSSLRKYPITVKNLLDEATDLKDNFYILCGLSNCWELIGSVTKVRDRMNYDQTDRGAGNTASDIPTLQPRAEPETNDCNYSFKNLDSFKVDDLTTTDDATDKTKSVENVSKWFFMIIENDFTEIQFQSRGFFVKYTNIVKAVNVARVSGKTVRLSSQKLNERQDLPQFGIYTIPHEHYACAFVGPYEKDELLELESVMKKSYSAAEKRSKGVWITTNKTDNVKVIDEPLLFLPQMEEYDEIILLDKTKVPTKRALVNSHDEEEIEKKLQPPTKIAKLFSEAISCPVKKVKPIKIRKSNGFYQLAPGTIKSSWLKSVSLLRKFDDKDDHQLPAQPALPSGSSTASPAEGQESFPTPLIQTTYSLLENSNSGKSFLDQIKNKPIAEIAPLIKAHNSASHEAQSIPALTGQRGMLILKPEEINQRHSEHVTSSNRTGTDEDDNLSDSILETMKPQIDMDIENFLATSEICVAPIMDNVYVVSDEEIDYENEIIPKIRDVWIKCQNIPTLGWIKGRRDCNNELSFEFPGFKFTNFYPESEAFAKINQVLSRKVYIPKQLSLEWKVFEREQDLNSTEQLKLTDLQPNHVLTPKGLRSKNYSVTSVKEKGRVCMSLKSFKEIVSPDEAVSPLMMVQKATEMIKDLKEKSKTLEEERDTLRSDMSMKKSELLSLILKVPENVRSQVTENIKNLD